MPAPSSPATLANHLPALGRPTTAPGPRFQEGRHMTETAILQEPAKEKKEKRRKKRIRVCFLRVEDLSEESRRRLIWIGSTFGLE